VSGEARRDSRARRGRHVVVVNSSVETGDGVVIEVGGADVGDVGAGVKRLVFRLVKVGRVAELDGGVCAGGDVGRGVGDAETGVTWVYLVDGNGVENLGKVGLGLGV
jgi:hypothetical protein